MLNSEAILRAFALLHRRLALLRYSDPWLMACGFFVLSFFQLAETFFPAGFPLPRVGAGLSNIHFPRLLVSYLYRFSRASGGWGAGKLSIYVNCGHTHSVRPTVFFKNPPRAKDNL